jgi:phosphatidylserine/phosphatidylglycerophosphate/cardiolipin synthase-like enzyme
MRLTNVNNGLKVQAIAGTYAVLLGFDLPQSDCAGLLGFSIHRTDHTENEAYYLLASKAFKETDPGFPPGMQYSTRDHPIQSFQWADYSSKPGHIYTYTITALKGSPSNLVPHAVTIVPVVSESPQSGMHDVYFNRGVAASQAYVRRFGDISPEDFVPKAKVYEWLSRGLNEALVDYIRSCTPGRNALRIAAYEFNYKDFLDLIKEVVDSGVDIQIVYDARQDNPKIKNEKAVTNAGLDAICFKRTQPKSYISHNKFIVKLLDGQPQSVWTGGTNFSEGGIYGHSNVAHVVEEAAVAQKFLEYWTLLKDDPESTPLKESVEFISPLPIDYPSAGTTVLFSPRKTLDVIDWYAALGKNAKDGLFMTFAFGMNDTFIDVYQNGLSPLRMALMEKKTRPMAAGPGREAAEQKIQELRNMPENVFAIGDFIKTNEIDGWVKESLSGLNSHVRYVHNKFMLINPLTDDPIVVCGSANFSDASTNRNDENMVIVRGNKRVADIYLSEFMRLYSHHAFRESLQWRDEDDPPKALRTDDWWSAYYGQNQRSTRRQFFAGSQE